MIAAALVILPLALLVLYYKALFSGLTNAGAIDLAQIGRNLGAGRGFTTYFLRPLAMSHGGNLLHQPDLTHGPLYPLLLALSFGALGAKDSVAAGVSGLFYVLTTPVLYLLGTRVFHRNVGLIAALVFTANPLMLEYSTSGLPITLFTFLTTCLLLVLYNLAVWSRGHKDNPGAPLPKTAIILTGVLTGALYLTDPLFVWILPVTLLAVLTLNPPRRRVQAATFFVLPFAVLTLPWMVRNGLLTGNPIFGLRGMEVWMGTRDFYPGLSGYRQMPGDLVPSAGLFNAVLRKMLFGVSQVVQAFPQVSASWMLAFLLPSLLFRFKDPAANSVRRVMMYCFVALLLGMLPFGVEMPLFASLIPAMLIFAVAYLLHIAEQAQLPRNSVALLTFLLSVVILLPLLHTLNLTEKAPASAEARSARALSHMVRPDEAVLSDQPWIVAWYADRPSVWIPIVDKNVGELRSQVKSIHWLFLTSQVNGFSMKWQTVYGTLGRWNQAYVAAKNTGQTPPDPVVIKGTGDPLLEGLDGFATVAPTRDTYPGTVIARISSAENH